MVTGHESKEILRVWAAPITARGQCTMTKEINKG